MKDTARSIILALVALMAAMVIMAACSGPDAGPDAISGRNGGTSSDLSSFACEDCHLSSGLPDINPLLTGGSGTQGKHVLHYSTRGFGCEKCHLGYTSLDTHFNGTIDAPDQTVAIVSFDTTNPGGTWINDNGPQTGQCSLLACHGPDTMDWYGTAPWVLPSCDTCHSAPVGPRRTITGAGGNFGASATAQSHHVAGGTDPLDSQCLTCHELSRHMLGTVRLNEPDAAGVIIYNSVDPSSAEAFCLDCHDGDGANGTGSPFADGETLGVEPYRMSAEIESYWNRTYGHHRQGLTCLGSGAPGTGCHANGHGSPYAGILARELELPSVGGANRGFEVADEPLYELCFNCHASYPGVTKEDILGVRAGGNYDWSHLWPVSPPYYLPDIVTTFRDQNSKWSGKLYDDFSWWGNYMNLHFWHIEDSVWRYRNTYNSRITCISCHNVHGSDTLYGWLYDELGWAHYTGSGSDEYGQMANPLNATNYPVGCVVNCHDTLYGGTTHMWFAPANE